MSAFTPAPTPTGAPVQPTAPVIRAAPAPATPAAAPAGSAPLAPPAAPVAAKAEEYSSAAGCLTLSLLTIAAFGALALFVALFGDIRM